MVISKPPVSQNRDKGHFINELFLFGTSGVVNFVFVATFSLLVSFALYVNLCRNRFVPESN